MADGNSSWVLPDKFTDDLLDEHGNKMSKRCGTPYTAAKSLYVLIVLFRQACSPGRTVCQTQQQLLQELHRCVHGSSFRLRGTASYVLWDSEYKKRAKAAATAKERGEKKVRRLRPAQAWGSEQVAVSGERACSFKHMASQPLLLPHSPAPVAHLCTTRLLSAVWPPSSWRCRRRRRRRQQQQHQQMQRPRAPCWRTRLTTWTPTSTLSGACATSRSARLCQAGASQQGCLRAKTCTCSLQAWVFAAAENVQTTGRLKKRQCQQQMDTWAGIGIFACMRITCALTLSCSVCQAARAAGRNPYPHKFHTTVLLPAYVAAYGALQAGEQRADEIVAIAGERTSPATHSRRGRAQHQCGEPCLQLPASSQAHETATSQAHGG